MHLDIIPVVVGGFQVSPIISACPQVVILGDVFFEMFL